MNRNSQKLSLSETPSQKSFPPPRISLSYHFSSSSLRKSTESGPSPLWTRLLSRSHYHWRGRCSASSLQCTLPCEEAWCAAETCWCTWARRTSCTSTRMIPTWTRSQATRSPRWASSSSCPRASSCLSRWTYCSSPSRAWSISSSGRSASEVLRLAESAKGRRT